MLAVAWIFREAVREMLRVLFQSSRVGVKEKEGGVIWTWESDPVVFQFGSGSVQTWIRPETSQSLPRERETDPVEES